MSLASVLPPLLLVLGLPRCDGDSRVSNANLFIDTLLLGRMPKLAPFEGIEPYEMDPVFVRVNIKNTFGHRFKANFSSTTVTGLSKVKRFNDCSRAAIRNGNITITCTVNFKEIEIFLDGFGDGDTTLKRSHRVQAKATFDETYALIEIAGPNRNEPGSLMRFDLSTIKLIIEPAESISLSSDRLAEFRMNLNNELSDRMKVLFDGKYKKVLENAISTVNLPPV
ncbi:uncharacterized protein LOC108864405 [Galendromus occidentalis]|uniref:Uncharacterized protein LOC108864405 n=1 Tax=Galendromus occidentalis TaxID=34638 RepID=A0AAJ7PA18_9ACAR|nr:uncharacterized protein LOC108864405 [Galendromus occidentalis]